MSFITAFFYDRFMAKTEAACLQQWRHELLQQVSGEVLEIGAGTGANISLYSDQVTRLLLTEPDKHMRRQLEEKLVNHDPAKLGVSGGTAENIEASDESFDYV
ncbi:MAG: class I SAM-dependent methyltransferase, partial [Gammaproteobacteria bacterium]|nr:class I SAM-dependent methyltransferase [Gammaproteobacteria bacterium]